MSVRLKVYMKEGIKTALLERAFGERQKVINDAKTALGWKVYQDYFTYKERRFMQQAPVGFLSMACSLRVKFAGDFTSLPLEPSRPVAAENRTKVYDANHPFTDEYRALTAAQKALTEERRQASAEAHAKLESVTTVARLIETWPEVKPFAEKYLTKAAAKKLPVIQNDALNATFKLPVAPGEGKLLKKARRSRA